ncbi:peptidoglycan bridge formation glycyltransferase FemA/FemB family protein [Candidatus Saccharibacteria bacterium]|nr:peptidoglycan bridge formation glycyltransferase FemA/FemB family protein [Candidatus Saccharibacteria bacterium]
MKKIFREITEAEFEKFIKTCPNKNYMQSVEMFRRYQEIGREAYLLGVVENDIVIAAGIASVIYERFGYKIFTFSRGPLADYKNNIKSFYYLLEQSKKFLKEKRGIILQISPNLLVPDAKESFKSDLKNLSFKYLGEYEQVKWIYTINFDKIENLPKVKPPKKATELLNPNLDKDAEQIIFRNFRKGHRYLIRYATERYNLSLRELKPEEYNIMFKLLEEAGKVHNFIPRDQKFFEQMHKTFNGKATTVIAELPDKTPVAVGFFIIYGDEIIYLSSGLSREHKQLGGPHLIQWNMIRYAYANGFKKYNFWGTNPDPNDGVFNFKQGFHGEVEEFVGTFAAPLNITGKLYLKKLKAAEHRDL